MTRKIICKQIRLCDHQFTQYDNFLSTIPNIKFDYGSDTDKVDRAKREVVAISQDLPWYKYVETIVRINYGSTVHLLIYAHSLCG